MIIITPDERIESTTTPYLENVGVGQYIFLFGRTFKVVKREDNEITVEPLEPSKDDTPTPNIEGDNLGGLREKNEEKLKEAVDAESKRALARAEALLSIGWMVD